jgi:hypothetical protein
MGGATAFFTHGRLVRALAWSARKDLPLILKMIALSTRRSGRAIGSNPFPICPFLILARTDLSRKSVGNVIRPRCDRDERDKHRC